MGKKVAFCEAGYDSFYGAQQSLYTFLVNVDREKIEPVFVSPGEGEFTKRISEIGIDVEVIRQPEVFNKRGNVLKEKGLSSKIKALTGYFKHVKRYMNYYKKENIETVYCNDIRSILTSGLAARLRGIPVVWYVRVDKRLGIFNWFASNIATRIVTISNNVQNIFPKKLIINANKKFKTIYTGINLEQVDAVSITSCLREELNVNKDTQLVALIGSIQPRKGQKDFIEAIYEIKKNHLYDAEDVKFLIVGDIVDESQRNYLEELKEMVKKNQMEEMVIFMGRRNDVLSIMKQVNLVVLPSYSEGLPRVVLESFACLCPVVATDVAGTGEIVDDKQNGLLIKPGNIEMLFKSILFMLEDKARTKEMGKNGRKKIEDCFKLESYISNLEELLLSV
jgi:glycosyltransferase involved in cell wall biosynthesis